MKGQVTAVTEGDGFDLLLVKVPRGTGAGIGTELEMSVSGHVSEQTFPALKNGRRVNTTASLEANTQTFKG